MQIRSQAQFQDLCQQYMRGEDDGAARSGCCPSWSLGNYLAVLTNASCCLSLTSRQVGLPTNKLLHKLPTYWKVDVCLSFFPKYLKFCFLSLFL